MSAFAPAAAASAPAGGIATAPAPATAEQIARARARWAPDGSERTGADYANAYQTALAHTGPAVSIRSGLPTAVTTGYSEAPSAPAAPAPAPVARGGGGIDVLQGGQYTQRAGFPGQEQLALRGMPGMVTLQQAEAMARVNQAFGPQQQAFRELLGHYGNKHRLNQIKASLDPKSPTYAQDLQGVNQRLGMYENDDTKRYMHMLHLLATGYGGQQAEMLGQAQGQDFDY